MSKMKKIAAIRELIPVTTQKIEQNSVQTVNARAVWEFLGVKAEFANWIQQKIKRYDFIEGQDYARLTNMSSERSTGSEHKIEYYVTLDMAQELSMVQNNPKGKEVRQYFIQCAKTLDRITSRKFNLDWKAARDKSIRPQLAKTDTIKIFVEYAQSQGSKSAKRYYENIQKMEYNALFEGGYDYLNLLSMNFPNVKTLKDLLSENQLFTLINADMIAEKALKDGMDLRMDYHDIFKLAKKRVLDFVELIGKSPIFNHQLEDKKIKEIAV